MVARRISSISTPIILAAVSVPLSIALLVGWMWVVFQNLSLTQKVTQNTLLMVLGGLFFVVIMGVLITFSVYLAREILEVRRQNSFIDSVTHELKSPLASIKLCLETLGRAGLAEEQRVELRTMMLDDVERLSSFIDDVLHSSRLAAGRVSVIVADTPLHELVHHCVEGVLSRYHLADDAVAIEVPEALRIATDATALAVVLRNLVDNAIKYSGEKPHVVVRGVAESGFVVLSVSDDGIGIARTELKRVFQRFVRVASEEVRSRKGTGLGLFVASSIVRNLGGTVHAESEGPGRGSTLYVRLPNEIRARSIPPHG